MCKGFGAVVVVHLAELSILKTEDQGSNKVINNYPKYHFLQSLRLKTIFVKM